LKIPSSNGEDVGYERGTARGGGTGHDDVDADVLYALAETR